MKAPRESLLERLEPLVGKSNAALLMSNVREGTAQFATQADVRLLGAELRTEMAGLRTEMADLRTELKTEMADLRTDISTVRTALTQQIGTAISSQTRTVLFSTIGLMVANAAGIITAIRVH